MEVDGATPAQAGGVTATGIGTTALLGQILSPSIIRISGSVISGS